MKKSIYLAMTILSLIFIFATTASALDITLAWDASPGPDIAGYNLYYQAASTNFADVLPIDVAENTTYSLADLPDGQIYYFAVTAYDANGYESAYSNIIASGWVPPLIAPTDRSAGQSTVETFKWETPPAPYDVTYTLYYGTDQQLSALTPSLGPESPGYPLQPVLIISLLALLGLTLVNSERTKTAITTGAITLALGLSLAACGGGGSSSPNGDISPTPVSAYTAVIETGANNYHVALDLEPATVYYWKVVASDQTNQGLKYESLTYSFTTAAN